ncbi:MAG: acetamidase/formamidase family protein [bacterium]
MRVLEQAKVQLGLTLLCLMLAFPGCQGMQQQSAGSNDIPEPQFTITKEHTHNKFSQAIAPALKVPSGAVVEVYTEEATDKQLNINSIAADMLKVQFDPIHPLTGPLYVEGAQPGDVLAVKLLEIEIGDWGWSAVFPGFGFLTDEFTEPYLKTFDLSKNKKSVQFNQKITIPLEPFAGVMGVAPDTEEMLSTIPPRANGGNMDDPSIVEGTTVYFPVFVEGALFSIGDTHAAQGLGEVCGTAVEAPMRIVYQVDVIKGGRKIHEPQYETETTYAVTAFATTIDEAARKATRYMVDYLEAEHGLERTEAYVLCSLAADLKIAEVVDMPHVLVTMHISKQVLGI